MKKSELREMVREVVEEELYKVLPELIAEALDNIIRKNANLVEGKRPNKKMGKAAFDPSSLRMLLGYGDMKPGMAGQAPVPETETASSVPTTTIAGVPMEGGLAAKERAAGLTPGVDPMTPMPPAGPASDILTDAIGRAKEVYEKSKEKANWRPGQPR